MRGLLGLLVALSSSLGGAATWYVNDATSLNDVVLPGCTTAPLGVNVTSCGGCANPCLTPNFLYANAPLGPGDLVYLNAGTYTEPTAVPVLNVNNASKTGTPGSPLTFRGVLGPAGLPLTLFDGNGVASGGVWIQTSWVTIENIAMTRFACPNFSPYGSGVVVAPTPLEGISLSSLEVFGTVCAFGAPIDFDSTAPMCRECKITGCTLHDNGATAGGIYTAGAGGIQILRNVIFNNTLTDATLPAIVLKGTPGAVVEGNLVYGNGGAGLSISKCPGCSASTGVLVRGNTFWGNQVATGASVAEVTITQQSSVTLEHNLIGASNHVVLQLDNTSVLLRSDYNDLFLWGTATLATKGGSGAATLAAWQTLSSGDLNSISVDPLFASTSAGAMDFHLQSVAGRRAPNGLRVFDPVTSPAIDRGDPTQLVGLEPAPHGGRLNLGVYGTTSEASLSPVQLSVVRGNGQLGPAGVPLPIPLEVVVMSQGSRPASDVGVRFAVAAGGSGGLSATTAITDAAGKASTFFTPALGLNSVSAELIDVGGASPVTFTATGSGPDAGFSDAGFSDAGSSDAGFSDAGSSDAGSSDAGSSDAGSSDAGVSDAGSSDAGSSDAGSSDAGSSDAGSTDAGSTDAGVSDAGTDFVPIVDLGCGCHSSGGPALLSFLLLWYRSRRRPSDGG